jgi:hypothetical protein
VENLFPLLLKSRNSLLPKASLTSPSVVLLVAQPEEPSVPEAMGEAIIIEARARCIQLPAAAAASRPKFPFSLAAISRYIAGIAIPNRNNLKLIIEIWVGVFRPILILKGVNIKCL